MNKRIALVSFITAVILLALLSLAVISRGYLPGDLPIRDFFAANPLPVLGPLIEFLNIWGSRAFVTVLIMIFYWRYREERPFILKLAMGVLLLAVFTDILKYYTDRIRPTGLDDSFPSGHVTLATFFYGALYLRRNNLFVHRKKLAGAILLIPILTMGFNRVFLQAHWLSDVLGGYLLGISWLSAFLLFLV